MTLNREEGKIEIPGHLQFLSRQQSDPEHWFPSGIKQRIESFGTKYCCKWERRKNTGEGRRRKRIIARHGATTGKMKGNDDLQIGPVTIVRSFLSRGESLSERMHSRNRLSRLSRSFSLSSLSALVSFPTLVRYSCGQGRNKSKKSQMSCAIFRVIAFHFAPRPFGQLKN